MFVQVVENLINLSREKKLVWKEQGLAQFTSLEPDLITDRLFSSRYKEWNLLVYEERMPPFIPDNNETIVRMQFLDDYGAFKDEFPQDVGLKKLYEVIKYQHRPAGSVELDRLVEVIAVETRARKLEWREEAAATFGLDPDTLTSPVYVTEFKGKRFVLFYEHAGNSTHKNPKTQATMWILDLQNKKLRDFKDIVGVDILFRIVNVKQPDYSALDQMVDTLVASTIKDVVRKMALQQASAKQ
ncbi:MAG: hypothetical protein EAZ92_11045 [Candidatus Kapaibacterium sp.]|nr:MAG: hypothetical protein EAZ92_11045 [Candidatus Kapabacteria bacterium]